MIDPLVTTLILAFGLLIIIIAIDLLSRWQYASTRRKLLSFAYPALLFTMLFCWCTWWEDEKASRDIFALKDIKFSQNRSWATNVAVYDGWPLLKAKFRVIGPSQPTINHHDLVMTWLERRDEDESFYTVVLHYLPGLTTGDVVETTTQGNVLVNPDAANIAGQ